MDDLKKKREEKVHNIVDKTLDSFENALKQKDLNNLYQRQETLIQRISKSDGVTKANLKLQLKQVQDSIDLLESQVDLTTEYDIEVDEVAARQFLKDNPDIIDETLIEQNDALDELERTLGLTTEKE